jgi:hypothetical protein
MKYPWDIIKKAWELGLSNCHIPQFCGELCWITYRSVCTYPNTELPVALFYNLNDSRIGEEKLCMLIWKHIQVDIVYCNYPFGITRFFDFVHRPVF